MTDSLSVVLEEPLVRVVGHNVSLGALLITALWLAGTWACAYAVKRWVLPRIFKYTPLDEKQSGIVARGVYYLIVLLGLIGLLVFVGVDVSAIWSFSLFSLGEAQLTIGTIVRAVIGFVIAVAVARVLRVNVALRMLEQTPLERGLRFAIARIVYYVALAIGVLIVLDTIGVDLTSLSLFGGLLGVGIGFGLQNIASNFISGIILLLERPVRVGDVVTVGDTQGVIQSISIRVTRILTYDNVMIYVPNARFIDDAVINWSSEDVKVRIRINVGVAYGSDVELVRGLLFRAAHESTVVLTKPEPTVWFTDFGNSSLDFALLVWVPSPDHRMGVASDLRFAINRLFAEYDVEIPFPQTDVHIRSAVSPEPVQKQESADSE